MAISVFNLFSIGLGPSSSHTVGPMRAARQFVNLLHSHDLLSHVAGVKTQLFGSLGLTGRGHATDIAVLLGLEGESPEGIDPNEVFNRINSIRTQQTLTLMGKYPVKYFEKDHLIFHKSKRLPYHSNAMTLVAYGKEGGELFSKTFYSVGGGFIVDHDQISKPQTTYESHILPYPFKTAAELLTHCKKNNLTIAQIMMANELTWRSEKQVNQGLLNIWSVMKSCIDRGCQQEGILPGGLNVRRRAAQLYRKLTENDSNFASNPSVIMDWVSLFALAVNEENAAGGRVVTAPTNGAAGILPAVLQYYIKFVPGANEEGIITYLLTTAAIGILYKEGASISAAEVGCQGEVGVACSMAAAGLTAVLGGTVEQIENAAEIGMEHNLGLTCDPVGGLVQIPCIERNTMGSIKAINAAQLALHGDGHHIVSLDQVIATMLQTGKDMKAIYKETSKGGLAVNVVAC
ncbi:MAG: sdaA [Chlamydiales bacterium]|jgi:L-serine dehydratase|nr:sdaA [Chlamydiales bacterium]